MDTHTDEDGGWQTGLLLLVGLCMLLIEAGVGLASWEGKVLLLLLLGVFSVLGAWRLAQVTSERYTEFKDDEPFLDELATWEMYNETALRAGMPLGVIYPPACTDRACKPPSKARIQTRGAAN